MNRYFAAFPAGAGALAERALRRRLPDLELLSLLDGAVEFATAVPYSDLNLFCFQNIFRVLHRAPVPAGERPLDAYLRQLLAAGDADWPAAGNNSPKIRTFRLVTSRENRLTAVDPALRARLEQRISRASGLRVDRGRPDTEFWVLSRREGTCWFLKRLTRHAAYDKLLAPGELHPEICWLMAFLSEPRHTDTVLDPFCGSGAIPAQRIKRFPYARLLAFDSDPACVARTRQRLPRRPEITVERRDALKLSETLSPESVDAVITDPPWGLYQALDRPLEDFYRESLTQLAPVLKPGGRLVWLTAGKAEFQAALAACPGFSLREEHGLLVSGKKCGLYLAVKNL